MNYRYKINYGGGIALLFTKQGNTAAAITEFYHRAGECFGIRKSITIEAEVMESCGVTEPPARFIPEECVALLAHSGGDTILWNADGEKIQTEGEDGINVSVHDGRIENNPLAQLLGVTK